MPIIFIAAFFAVFSVSASERYATLRVGVYENPPKILLNSDGQISGIFGDLLTQIAISEGWKIEPVPCEWSDCLRMIDAGELDLMPNVASSAARDARLSFHETPALLSWSQVYAARGSRIDSLLALDGKRVAVLRNSFQQDYLQELAIQFELNTDWVLADKFEQALEDVIEGRADATVSNQFIGDQMAHQYGLEAVPVLFQPTWLYFVAPEGSHAGVLEAIDKHLDRWKSDSDSVYFYILDEWTFSGKSQPVSTAWRVVLLVLLVALLLAALIVRRLRSKVFARTDELRKTKVKLDTVINNVEAYVYIKDKDLRYKYVNERCASLFNMNPKDILGLCDKDLFDEKTCIQLRENDLRVIEHGERVEEEEEDRVVQSGKCITVLSVKVPLLDKKGNIYALCGVSTDISAYKRAQEDLHELAYYDSLTGLANRRKLLDRLNATIDGTHDDKDQGAMMLIGLDNFKSVNDTLGHSMGDELLKEVAELLLSEMLPGEYCARLGADEFAVVLPFIEGNQEESRQILASRAASLVHRMDREYQLDTVRYSGTASLGAILYSDLTNISTSSVMKGADLALYAAKKAGKNTYAVFNQCMQDEIDRHTSLESKLRIALANDELELYLQPQWNQEEKVVGLEALLRWNDSELGFISPAEFIPVAETCGLIIPMGDWVLRTACQTLAEWENHERLQDLTISVNISVRQFRHPNFVASVEKALMGAGAAGEKLKFEVTESLLIDDLGKVTQTMESLRELGITFALDDFGTGYASLGYLKRLPLCQLKVDQSFVCDLLNDPNDEAITQTIIALGQSLNLEVLAEGVETAEQKQRLMEMGCELFQGYYFGRPEPINSWAEKLKDGVIHSIG